ncbi:MAG: DUF2855 family protein [Acidimicrobiales bacterium]
MIIEVDRTDLHRSRTESVGPTGLDPGQSRLRVDGFALTSNNITYGALGDALMYWNFFPAEGNWGRIPVWGFADVVESRADGVEPGLRVYGYFPMGDELVVTPAKADERGFFDAAEHRRPMAGAYNRYLRTDADPIHETEREGQQMVLWPLFFTSFMIDDYLADNDLFGASTVVISSASSKTAVGTAFLVHDRPGVRVVGLTSEANHRFVTELGCYHEVVTYADIASLPVDDAVYIDVAGNRDVQAAAHQRFGRRLAHSLIVGATHWDHRPEADEALPGPEPSFFFAPTQIAKRTTDWGQAELDRVVGSAWRRFVAWTDGWLELRRSEGAAEVVTTYHELLDGRSEPHVGHVCRI